MWNNRYDSRLSSADTNAGQSGGDRLDPSRGREAIDGIDCNTIRLAANIRSIFGDNLSSNLLNLSNKMSATADQSNASFASRHHYRESDASQSMGARMTSAVDEPYSRRDASIQRANNQFSDDDFEYRGPQPSTFRTGIPFLTQSAPKPQRQNYKSERHLMNTGIPGIRAIEDEDLFLYGDSSSNNNRLPPGIVNLDEPRAVNSARTLSPISKRLNREMEGLDWGRRPSPPKEIADWPTVNESRWEEDDNQYRNRVERNINRSPKFDDMLRGELERARYKSIIDSHSPRLRSPSQHIHRNESPPIEIIGTTRTNRNSNYNLMSRQASSSKSPLLSPNRSFGKSNRRIVSPLYTRKRSRSRSSSRNRYKSRSRSRSRSRNKSDSRSQIYRRSRSPKRSRSGRSYSSDRMSITPEREYTSAANTYDRDLYSYNSLAPNPSNPFGPIMSFQNNSFMPGYADTTSAMAGHYSQMQFPPVDNRPKVYLNFNQRNIPLSHLRTFDQKIQKTKIEEKLINPRDLLLAERAKLRQELNSSKIQLEKKINEQKIILSKEGGKTSYINKQLEKIIGDLKNKIENTHKILEKNANSIHFYDKDIKNKTGKLKEKEFRQSVAPTINVNKNTIATKQTNKENEKSEESSLKKIEDKGDSNKAKKEEDDEENESSRFYYFDSGYHWCKSCNKFFSTAKSYFEHIHSKDHLTKQKDIDRDPWKEKSEKSKSDALKIAEKLVKSRDQLRVPCKGHQFIYPARGFYCSLCKDFLVDENEAELHFKSPKHNRFYTRYCLLNNDYEPKWRLERDRAYTEYKRSEREEEQERSRKAYEEKVAKRKKLVEELKRKEKEVKQKIELMNKNAKVVNELDGGHDSSLNSGKHSGKSSKDIKLNLSDDRRRKIKSPTKTGGDRQERKGRNYERNRMLKNKDKSYRDDNPSDRSKTSEEFDSDIEIIDEIKVQDIENLVVREKQITGLRSNQKDGDHVITSFEDIYGLENKRNADENDVDMENELNSLRKEIEDNEIEFDVQEIVREITLKVAQELDDQLGLHRDSRLNEEQENDANVIEISDSEQMNSFSSDNLLTENEDQDKQKEKVEENVD